MQARQVAYLSLVPQLNDIVNHEPPAKSISQKQHPPANVIATHLKMAPNKSIQHFSPLAIYTLNISIETPHSQYISQKLIHAVHNHGLQLITQGALGQGVQDDSSHA